VVLGLVGSELRKKTRPIPADKKNNYFIDSSTRVCPVMAAVNAI
jgi:hypothetical protein